MSRILPLLSLCFFSGCYWYPPYNYGYPSYPPGYVASYPAYNAGGYAPDHGAQIYGPYGQPNYHEPAASPPPRDQAQPQNFGGAQPAYPSHADCDSPENPMACN